MHISKRLIKKQMLKHGINTENDANSFMDKITDKLSDYDLKRAYYSAKEKHERKNNENTLYMLNYFKTKLEIRGVKYE